MNPELRTKPKIYRALWLITGTCSLILLTATIALVLIQKKSSGIPITGYVTSSSPTVIMRSIPNTDGLIITLLPRGSKFMVIDSKNQDNTAWLEVETEEFIGWIPAKNVTEAPP